MELAQRLVEQTDPRAALQSDAGDLTKVWFALEERPWTALLVVPARSGADIAGVATSLLDVAVRACEHAPVLVDARGLTADSVRMRVAEIEGAVDRDRRAIVVIDSPLTCAPALALARKCDAALLCVDLKNTLLDEARQTMEACGRDRFVGAVVVRGGTR